MPKIQWPLPADHKPLWTEDDFSIPDREMWTQAYLRLFNRKPPNLGADLRTLPHKHIRAYMDLGDAFIYFLDHCIIAIYCDAQCIYPPLL